MGTFLSLSLPIWQMGTTPALHGPQGTLELRLQCSERGAITLRTTRGNTSRGSL